MTGMPKTIKERVDAIADNRNLSLDTKPTTCKLELTGICSLDCQFCYHTQMKQNKERQHYLSEEDFETAIRYIQIIPSIKEVGLFYMGESALHPKLAKFYRRVKEFGYFTYLTTNGTFIENVIPAVQYIDSLKVSFNYTSEDDFLTKTNSTPIFYNRIKDNIRTLAEICHNQNKELTVSTVLDTKREDYQSSISMLKRLGADHHYFIPLQNQGGTKQNGADGVIGEADAPVKPLPCWSLFKGLYIDCDLNVRTCCYGHGREHILGNLRNIEEMKNKRNYMAAQLKSQIPDICRNCLRTKED